MENVNNRINLHLTDNEDNAVRWFSKIKLKIAKSIDDLYLIQMYKSDIEYDEPIYVWTSILDLNNLHMIEFHYEVIAKQLIIIISFIQILTHLYMIYNVMMCINGYKIIISISI